MKPRTRWRIAFAGFGWGVLVLLFAYFAAGFFFPVLPWAPLASVVTSAIGLWRDKQDDGFLMRWWEVSKPRAIAIVTGLLLRSVALDMLAMLLANWLRRFF